LNYTLIGLESEFEMIWRENVKKMMFFGSKGNRVENVEKMYESLWMIDGYN